MDERLEGLFNEYSPMVFRLCLRYVPSREEAEDLTQEIFLKVDRKLPEFRGESAISTWIYRMAANFCLDFLRTSKRRKELSTQYLTNVVLRNLASGGDRELARIDLDHMLDQAKPEVREILLLTQLEGMTCQEAAKVTGKSAQVIAKTISRFKKSEPVKIRILELKKLDRKTSGKDA